MINRLSAEKVFYHSEKLLELKNTGDTWPVHMQIGLTSFCNHKCIFCHGGHNDISRAEKTEMDLNVLMRCLEQAKKHGLKAVTFVGNGEPLAYSRIDELLERLRDMGLEVGVFSNGGLLNEKRRELIADFATFIRFSVNGSNEEEHSKVHQVKGQFHKVTENIKALVELRKAKGKRLPTIGAQMVFYEDNYKSIYNATKMWKEIGVDYFEIKPLVETPFGLHENARQTKDKAEIVRQMEKAKTLADENFAVYAKYNMYETTIDNPKRSYDKCYGQAISVDLLENGNLPICASCEFSDEYSCGNIYEQDFEEIWTSERRKNILKNLDISKCKNGCKQHPLNEVIWDYLHPNKEHHPNFI